ncbi:MAG: type I-U CRISPR-associated protein Csx17 [Myxococcales bacterium]|nr:type I-U CRISPR-associated protein Csx17 [Myxococcales bacterium]
MTDHSLGGCRPLPLAGYLKGLGVLRLVAEQVDANAAGYWSQAGFVLRTELSAADVIRFFLEDYRPSPIVGPWGARSGFYPGSSESAARAAREEIEGGEAPRLLDLQSTIRATVELLSRLGIDSKDAAVARKQELMEACRSWLPDAAIAWIDACYVLAEDSARFPPLLGSGGNEGSGSYMSGFLQQVSACLVARSHDAALEAALWGRPSAGISTRQTPGHFLPAAGGANTSSGFEDAPLVNPWDYLLCLEGALLFAAALSRRGDAGSRTRLSFPFTVGHVDAGHGTSATEKTRAEFWAPLWSAPTGLAELRHLLGEGRATVGAARARDAIDFARAISQLGVDRGITSFERYSFVERNGLSNIAVPLGSHPVRVQAGTELLAEIDPWLDRFRSKATGKLAPAAVRRALGRLQEAILELCGRGGQRAALAVLIALGQCERSLSSSLRWAQDSYLQPIPPLNPAWMRHADDGSVELRLAAALASVYVATGGRGSGFRQLPLRCQLEPIAAGRRNERMNVWWDSSVDRDVVPTTGRLELVLSQVLLRRVMLHQRAGAPRYLDCGHVHANLADVGDFIEGRVDERRLVQLLWGTCLVDWSAARAEGIVLRKDGSEEATNPPNAFYGLLKLCFAGRPVRGQSIPLAPHLLRQAYGGRGGDAARHAVRRLRGCGLVPAVKSLPVYGTVASRSGAALIFPLAAKDVDGLTTRIFRPRDTEMTTAANTTATEG